MLLQLFIAVLALTTASGNGLDGMLDKADQAMNELTSRVSDLSAKLDASLKGFADQAAGADGLSRKLDRKEGKNGACNRGFFPCGAGVNGGVQCVRDYLVCDGSADCKNRADESDKVCSRFPFGKRVKMPIDLWQDTCVARGQYAGQHYGRKLGSWIVTSETNPMFPSRPKMTLVLKHRVEYPTGWSTHHIPGIASYDYATGDIIFRLPGQSLFGRAYYDPKTADKSRFEVELGRNGAPSPCRYGVLSWA